jgi:hypothetical protein
VHGIPWWNDIDRRKFLIRLPELFGSLTISYLVAKQKEKEKE